MLDLILARNLDNTTAIDNMIPWKCEEDIHRFKLITNKYEYMVMGRKTYEELPLTLSGKKHLVVTREPEIYKNTEQTIFCNLKEAEEVVQTSKGICIGGAKTASELMPYIDTIFLTTIKKHDPDCINLLPIKKFDYPIHKYFVKSMDQMYKDHSFSIYER